MSDNAMREMTKDELIAGLTTSQLADLIIMERQHIREIKDYKDKTIADLTRANAVMERALELAIATMYGKPNHMYPTDNCEYCEAYSQPRYWKAQAEQEVKK